MRALLSLALLLALSSPLAAQPTRAASEARLSVQIKEINHYRVVDGWYGPSKAYAGTSYDWRGLANGDRVSEVEFYRIAGNNELADRIARTKRSGRIMKWGGLATSSVGLVLFLAAQANPDNPDAKPNVVVGLTGVGLTLTGLVVSYAGISRADGNRTSVNEAIGAFERHRQRYGY